MTLTADQLEELISNALVDIGEYVSAGDVPAYKQAYADLAAMRQPITAEALTAAGWVRQYATVDAFWRLDGCHLFIDDDTIKIWHGPNVDSWIRTRVTNMYALGQLVELLGGGA